MRVVVRYDAGFARPNTWVLAIDGSGVRARFKLGEAPELVVDVRVRWLRQAREDLVAFHPFDAAHSIWISETSRFPSPVDGNPQVGVAVILQLNDAPEHVAEALRQL